MNVSLLHIDVFRILATCSLVVICRRFRSAYCHHQMKEGISTYKTSVNFYKIERLDNPDDRNLISHM